MGIFKFVIVFFLLGSSIYASDHSSNEKECLDSKAKNYLKSLRSLTLPVKGYSIKKGIRFHEEKAINFKANLKALSRGYVQFAKATYTDLEMKKFRKSPYYSLDFLGWSKRPNIALSVYRYAYITPRKSVEWFNLKKMTDKGFLEKTIKGVVAGGVKVQKPVGPCSKVYAKFKTDLDMGGIKIGTVVFRGDYYSLDRKNLVGKNFPMNDAVDPKVINTNEKPKVKKIVL